MNSSRIVTTALIAAGSASVVARIDARRPTDGRRSANRDHHRRERPRRSDDRHGLRRLQPRQQAHARSSRPVQRARRSSRSPSTACRPGRRSCITAAERGHPVAQSADIPAGEYWMQPFVNVYTRFARADGKTVWLHMDQWEGQNWKRSPGNLFGEPVRCSSIRGRRRRFADRRQSHSADSAAGGHRAGQADQDPERDPHEVVGASDLPGRHGAAAEGLRQASRRPFSGQLRAGPLLAARAGRLRHRRCLRHVLARRRRRRG